MCSIYYLIDHCFSSMLVEDTKVIGWKHLVEPFVSRKNIVYRTYKIILVKNLK